MTSARPTGSRPTTPLRWLLALAVVVGVLLAASSLLALTDSALSVWQRLEAMPAWLRALYLGLLGILTLASVAVIWWLLRPRRQRKAKTQALDRATLERRIAALEAEPGAAEPARAELAELDRRREQGDIHAAVFGAISTGKSSLVRALAPHADVEIDVRGGSTREVRQARGSLPGGRELQLADVPGTQEHDGAQWTALAEREAARAHVLMYVVDGDLSRSQHAELQRIAAFGKPLLLVLNKADRFNPAELDALGARLTKHAKTFGGSWVGARAGGQETVLRRLPDGREESLQRERRADISELRQALLSAIRPGAAALEPARESAVVAGLDAELSQTEIALRQRRSDETVRRYTRRAMVGAMAAVAPGSDLVIQGVLATALTRELARIHELEVRDLDLDAFLARAGGLVRTTSTLTMAVVGNALKAFPGFGTLGGGLMHAVAYGLIFDSLGRALASTFAETRKFDRDASLEAFSAALKAPAKERIGVVLGLAREALDEAHTPSREAKDQ